ncbi:MAG: electron transfer flavoprotein subunit alpha/FixB family protein [Chloroflexi bacterium]|nr:electron transfer flavoprotein subunit alpha/FixB family protein [Chloroflexota bacterium]
MIGSKPILIVAQNEGGRLAPVVFEGAAAARRLTGGASGGVAAVVTGPPGTEAVAKELWSVGVADVYVAEHTLLAEPRPESHALAIAAAVRQADPSLILVGQTFLGRDLAPYLAAMLEVGVIMNALELRHDSSGATEVVCPIYGGAVQASYHVSASPPSVVGFQPATRSTEERASGSRGRILSVDPGLGEFKDKVKLVERPLRSGPRLEEAKVVVSGGVGLGDAKNYQGIEELAEVLGGLPGASRAIVDLGWATRAQQVGLTGARVSPDLYVAVGISGASQHLAGMSMSKVIVAVNNDPKAPIFKYARYGVTLDCLEFLPAFTSECRKLKGTS